MSQAPLPIFVWLCRGTLALVFATSAIAKARNRRTLENYLHPVFRRASYPASYLVIIVELVLAAIMTLGPRNIAALSAVTAITVLTAFYAAKLSITDNVRCACWGQAPGLEESFSLRDAMLQPFFIALRNGTFIAAGLLMYGSYPRHTWATQVTLRLIIGMAGTQMLLVIGLTASIALKKRRLAADMDSHPLTLGYARRWIRVRGCSDFDLRDKRQQTPVTMTSVTI
jgi:hypothetical protein